YGNYNTIDGNFYGTTGFTDTLAGDIALYYHDQQEGFGKNLTTGQDAYKAKDQAGRIKLQYRDDLTTITFGADYSKSETDMGASRKPVIGPNDPGGVYGYTGDFYNVIQNPTGGGFGEQWGVNLRIARELPFAEFVSMSNYR